MAALSQTSTIDEMTPWEKYLALFGSGMMGGIHGAKQIAHGAGLKSKALGTTDQDIDELAANAALTSKLSDKTPGGWAAELAGGFADPVMLAGGRVASLPFKALTSKAVVGGGLQGVLGETEDSTSRLGSGVLGAATGKLMTKNAPVKKDMYKGVLSPNLSDREVENLINVHESGKLLPGPRSEGYIGGAKEGKSALSAVRFPIDPSSRKVDIQNTGDTNKLLGDVVDWPEFFASAPKKGMYENTPVHINIDPKLQRPGGSYDTITGELAVSAPNRQLGESGLYHEMTHLVQKAHGWPFGDDPKRLDQSLDHAKKQIMNSRMSPKEKKYRLDRLEETTGIELYLRSLGEREAYDTEQRAMKGTLSAFNPSGQQYPQYVLDAAKDDPKRLRSGIIQGPFNSGAISSAPSGPDYLQKLAASQEQTPWYLREKYPWE